MWNWTEKVSTYMDGMLASFLLILVCLPMSGIVWQCACIIIIVNLPAEMEGMGQFMWEKKINKWNHIIMYVLHCRNYTDEGVQYDNTSQKLSHQIEQRKYLPTWTECDWVFFTNSCMFPYEWHCITMCTCIILIANLPTG